jgi:predicted nucleic acid-binding protein
VHTGFIRTILWLLDTDVICQPATKKGDPKVIAWLEAEQDRCYTSAVVIAQLAYWVRTKEGRQRQTLQAWLTRLVDALHGRIHGFNVSVALDVAVGAAVSTSMNASGTASPEAEPPWIFRTSPTCSRQEVQVLRAARP